MTHTEADSLTAALSAAGSQIIREQERAAHEHERWREVSRRFGDLRERVHEDGVVHVLALDELQTEIFTWQTKNFGDQPAGRSLLGCVEEIGELAHAVLKQEQGIRGTPEEHIADAKDAIGDLGIFLLNYCSARGWSLEDILLSTWREVSARDWIKFPGDGLTR